MSEFAPIPDYRTMREATPQEAQALRDDGERKARAEWDRIVPELLTAGLLTKLDRAALVGYCVAWGQWIDALDQLRAHGVLVKSPSGYPLQSPYLAIFNRAVEQVRSLGAEFGLSPSARVRLKGVAQGDLFDGFDEFVASRA